MARPVGTAVAVAPAVAAGPVGAGGAGGGGGGRAAPPPLRHPSALSLRSTSPCPPSCRSCSERSLIRLLRLAASVRARPVRYTSIRRAARAGALFGRQGSGGGALR